LQRFGRVIPAQVGIHSGQEAFQRSFVWLGLIGKVAVRENMLQAVITETVTVGVYVPRVADVIVVNAVHVVVGDDFPNNRKQILIGVTGTARGAHPDVRIRPVRSEHLGRGRLTIGIERRPLGVMLEHVAGWTLHEIH
jgi:hypothetical protein